VSGLCERRRSLFCSATRTYVNGIPTTPFPLRYENFQPIDPAEMKEREKNAPAREWDDDEKPWKPVFWAAIAEDLRTVEYPSTKKVFQTFLISQVAFIVVIVVTLLFDAVRYIYRVDYHSATAPAPSSRCPVRLSDSTLEFPIIKKNETPSRNSLMYMSKAN